MAPPVAKDSWSQLEGHRTLPELLRELEAAADLATAKTKLTELRDVLEPHFAMEERSGGFFEELRDVQPCNVPRIKELTEEHGVILARTDSLLDDMGTSSFDQSIAEISKLCATIRAHDESEHQLFLDSYLIDHGGGS